MIGRKATGFKDMTDKVLQTFQHAKTPEQFEKLRGVFTKEERKAVLHRAACDKEYAKAFHKEAMRLWKWLR